MPNNSEARKLSQAQKAKADEKKTKKRKERTQKGGEERERERLNEETKIVISDIAYRVTLTHLDDPADEERAAQGEYNYSGSMKLIEYTNAGGTNARAVLLCRVAKVVLRESALGAREPEQTRLHTWKNRGHRTRPRPLPGG